MTIRVVLLAVAVAGCKGKATTRTREATGRAADAGAIDAGTCKDERAVADPAGLAFVADLDGRLDVELTEALERIDPKLMNEKAPPTATIKRVDLVVHVFPPPERRAPTAAELEGFLDAGLALEDLQVEVVDPDAMRPLTEPELERVVFRGRALELRGLGQAVKHAATDCVFTVRDVLDAVEETERQTRGDSEWFEGVDVHHVYFEGLSRSADGVWEISWGS